MKGTALLLSVAIVINTSVTDLQAQPVRQGSSAEMVDSSKAARVKADVARRGVGEKSRVRVKLKSKKKLKGFIYHIDDESFDLAVEPEEIIDPQPVKDTVVTIQYDEVEKIQGPRSRAADISIGVGVTVVVVVALAAILALEIWRHQDDP
jgi:hypothetical protein